MTFSQSISPIHPPAPDIRSLSILLVDDDPAHAEAVERAFRDAGSNARIRTAGTLREYRAAMADDPPDIALVDLNLPDGRAVEILTSPPEAGPFPVVIMTSFGDEQIAVLAMKSGAMDYVVKSFEAFTNMPRTIARVLREWTLLQDRRKAEESLRKAKLDMEAIFQGISHPIVILDPDQRIISGNKKFEELVGQDIGEYRNRQCWKLFHGSEATGPPPDCPFMAMKQSHGAETSVMVVETLDGIFLVSCTPIFDAEHRLEKVIHIATDITEQKRAETELRESQKMDAIGRLAGGVAHDFNNMLSIINGYAELLLMKLKEDDPLCTDVGQILKAGNRAADLTRQLLAFSRKSIVQPKVISLNTVVSGVEKMLQRLIGEDIRVAFEMAGDLGHVRVDPGLIEQVIMNLAVNARDAMPLGGQLTIETRNVDLDESFSRRHVSVSPGSYVMLAVSDTGAGMDEATRQRIFEPFFTTKEKGKGTGLGLSMVYGIVKQNNGSIWVYSEPGQGTAFKIYLPRIAEAVELEQIAPVDPTARGTETILIVEDEEAVCTLVKKILLSAGYQVLTAINGGEALMLLERRQEPVHLLLTDVVMPGMSGRELADRLLKIHPEMKVLFMSGYTDDAIVHHGVLDPDAHFIGKPFAMTTVQRKVREVLDSGE
ncbi:MAG: response regulator [Pseudomonadota bacterium]